MEGEEAAKYLPPKLSISLKDREAGGNKKFYGNGQFKHFPGNTTVCMVPRHSKQFQLLVQAQQLIRQSPLCDHYALLPPSSFHMTVHDLNSHTPEGLNILEINHFWKENHRKMQTILAPLLESSDWTVFRMNFSSMTPKGNLLNLVPSSPRTERGLASWRANLQTRLHGKPIFSNYGFHITLAYLLHPITTPEGNAELNKLIQLLTHHFSTFGEIELEPPRLTRFHDMSEYLPMLGTMDTGLLLCYDIATGNGCFANCYEYGSGLELRTLKWSQGWSQFVPFVFENETYCRLHIVNAKSAHVAIDIITLVYKPGYTHVVYVFHNNEPLVVLYNYNSNDLCILKIDFAKLGFAPYISTTLSPGGFTHLIECNSFLLAYSGVTGDMVAFQIQPSGKRVVSAAFAPLARGITSITSLSSGFGIHNATPGRFFAYEAGTGKSFVFGFSSDRFSSSMETTLEVGLSIVIPVRLGDSDYIYAYRAQTGALQIYKGVSNGRSIAFSLFARHSLPPALTNLIFLDRRMREELKKMSGKQVNVPKKNLHKSKV